MIKASLVTDEESDCKASKEDTYNIFFKIIISSIKT